ncbi:MAG: Gfo/Idh/MocA family oxidoreductase [Verrucomicrobia bacterium]|nr:Gfo/Idh/MocA family oxidoreductase [Verrucomicrobiota bacterium]
MLSRSPSAPHDLIRWGIIGCGDVTEVKSGPGFQQARGSQLVAVMRRNGALAADYARRHGVPRWYDDARALVNDPGVDAVYVATPPGAHLDGARLAAAAGKPAYVEKPMARHAPECDAMIAAFAAAKQKLFVAYYRRALPRFLKVKELLDGGALGTLTGVSYRMSTPAHATTDPAKLPWRLNAEDAGGGLLLDVGSHTLDLLDFFCGPLTEVHGTAARLAGPGDVEDAVTMTFRTAAGVPGSAAWNFASQVKDDRLEFTGTDGRVTLSVFSNEPLQLESARGVEFFELPNPPHIQQPMIQTVVDELLGRSTCPSTGESAQRTSAVMDRVLAAYYGGRDDAFWLRPLSWPGRK